MLYFSDSFMCYWCHHAAADPTEIAYHTVQEHFDGIRDFSLRKKILSEKTGLQSYETLHFRLSLPKIRDHIQHGDKILFDTNNTAIRIKRVTTKQTDGIQNTPHQTHDSNSTQTSDNAIYASMPQVISKLRAIGRDENFLSLLTAIAEGHLDENIALHLILDVGAFYGKHCINNIRFSEESLSFWVTVSKLFKGKGLNFFRGYKGECLNLEHGAIRPRDCLINFAVPSDPTIVNTASKYRIDVERPGIIETTLQAYSERHADEDCKLCIDGKKLAYGVGNAGEEDLCGFETSPTLKEREKRHSEEITNLKGCKDMLNAVDETCLNHNLQAESQHNLKAALLVAINHMSSRIRELRLLIVKRELTVEKYMNQVEGDWQKSDKSSAISYWLSK